MSNKTRFAPAARPLSVLGLLLFLALMLAACGGEPEGNDGAAPLPATQPPAAAPPAGAVSSPPAEPTPLPQPTLTPTPALAALVNEQPITLEEFERELVRYEQTQAELNVPLDENYQNRVLLSLVEQRIIEQAAAANNIVITPEMVEARVAQLIQEAGGEENFIAWLAISQLSREEFVERLTSEMITEQVVNLITADVPFAVEQVRARHIEVTDPALAQSLVEQARAGADFAGLAATYSQNPSTQPVGGDLGFFARGFLFVPEIEAAAFALQPGETSDAIAVQSGGQTVYHIVQVVERDPARPLDGNPRAQLLQQTFESWLTEQLAGAQIVRFVE